MARERFGADAAAPAGSDHCYSDLLHVHLIDARSFALTELLLVDLDVGFLDQLRVLVRFAFG